jgi:arginase family enzyme
MKIIKIPFNGGALSKKKGIEKAPDIICKKLYEFGISENGCVPVIEIESVEVNNSNISQSDNLIREKITQWDSCIIIGGDHSVTLPCFQGFIQNKNRINKKNGIIIFDAHPDLMDSNSTHEDYLRNLIDSKEVKSENVILVGVRNADAQEFKYIIQNKIKNFPCKEIALEGKDTVCDSIMSVARTWDNIYLSIDIDVLDPAFAPGTGYPEPGGLTTRELLYFIQRLKLLNKIRIIDIVEVNPDLDLNEITSKVAAKLILELL